MRAKSIVVGRETHEVQQQQEHCWTRNTGGAAATTITAMSSRNPFASLQREVEGFPPLCAASLVFEATIPPSMELQHPDYPRPTNAMLSDNAAYHQRVSKLESVTTAVHQGDASEMPLCVELQWQVKVFRLCYCYPELLLTGTEMDTAWGSLQGNFIDSDGLMLKGTRGGKGGSKDKKMRLSKKDKRANVQRKFFYIARDNKRYHAEMHVCRIKLLHERDFPTAAGQHTSHTCSCWACMLHVLWEDDWVNTKVRKCHDKCKCRPGICKCTCTCGSMDPCIFPCPHDEFHDKDPRPTPKKQRTT